MTEVTQDEVQVAVATPAPLAVSVAPVELPLVAMANVGPVGPQGPPGQWEEMTQAEFNQLAIKDPATLYVIIG